MHKHVSSTIAGNAALECFIERAETCCSRENPDLFWEMRKDFDQILCKSIWQGVYLRSIQRLIDQPTFDGGRDWYVNGLAVYDSSEFSLSIRTSNNNEIGILPTETKTLNTDLISSRPAPSMLSVMSPTAEIIAFYRFPTDFNPDVYDPLVRIAHYRNETALPWHRIDVNSSIETVDIQSRPGARWCLLEFSLKPVVAQRWEFRKSDGAPTGSTLTKNDSAALLAMLGQIGRAGYRAAVEEVACLLDHPDFNVRWAAAKCIGKIDPARIEDVLSMLSSDDHPLIATTARTTLAKLMQVKHSPAAGSSAFPE